MVAGMGFEPHDLRVMSPTSYQTALPRDIFRSCDYDSIAHFFSFVKPFLKIYTFSMLNNGKIMHPSFVLNIFRALQDRREYAVPPYCFPKHAAPDRKV